MAAPNEITPAQLSRLIGTPACPAIIDIRIAEDVADDPGFIPGSVQHAHTALDSLAARIETDRTCVIVCQKGLKLSQGVTAWLRTEGIYAEYLKGGMFAWRALPDAPLLRPDQAPMPSEKSTLWVTRHRPKIDRIACPWLIRRFVDRQAKILYVAPSEVMDVAQRFGAEPFDVPGAALGHNGERCTFDAILTAYGLTSPALQTMAQVIRAADTNRLGDAPQAAGLLALSIGLSRLYRDDTAQLQAGLAFYDALYRWARDGMDETHDSQVEAQQ